MSTGPGPGVAVVPHPEEGVIAAIDRAGGHVVDPEHAEGLVWTDPGDADALKKVLESSPARWVQLPFAGIEEFVAAGAIDRDRIWTSAKAAYGHACAEHALALMLAAARRLHEHATATSWRAPGFGSPEMRLKDKIIVLVGTGGIGEELAAMLSPLQARVIGVNRSGRPLPNAEQTVTQAGLASVLPDADFVVLAAAVTAATRGLFDREMLGRMKSSAWLVNVGRGVLVDTDALVEAVAKQQIAGAALDVTDPEPLPDGHPLWALPNVVITPHIANTWDMALPELRSLVERNVSHFANGRPLEGLVDVEAGY